MFGKTGKLDNTCSQGLGKQYADFARSYFSGDYAVGLPNSAGFLSEGAEVSTVLSDEKRESFD